MAGKVLDAQRVSVAFKIAGEFHTALHDVDLAIQHGEVVALVGESGSGKSTFATAVMGLHNAKQTQVTGQILLDDEELVTKTDDEMTKIRGAKIGMIFQDPLAALNPLMKIGDQIVEAMRVHKLYPADTWRQRAEDLLNEVGITNAQRVANQFPHQLSGGMRQRVMIAIAIANEPDLIIADEPTTALDVTIQAQILDLIKKVQVQKDAGVLLITHDLGVVAEVADTVAVMYAGQIVEKAPVQELFDNPKHPYTRSLLRANPTIEAQSDELYVIPGTVPALAEMDHQKDLFLQRVPWLPEEIVNQPLPDAMSEISTEHLVRGTAWQQFEFPDIEVKP
jgi:peptide/nickel transport system ATP-binding protein